MFGELNKIINIMFRIRIWNQYHKYRIYYV